MNHTTATAGVLRHVDMVMDAARRFPDAIAVTGPDGPVTYAELDQRVGRLGSALRGLGLVAGDRVALLAANEREYVEIQAACVRSGFVLVPLNTRLAEPELAYIIGDCRPAVLIGGRTQHQRLDGLCAPTGPVALGLGEPTSVRSYEDLVAQASPSPRDDSTDPHAPCLILYTSGTTGRPKGAVIDRAAFGIRVLVDAIELEAAPDGVFLAALPMFHIAAFLAYAHVVRGGTVVMLPSFEPEGCLATIEAHGVTAVALVPTMINSLLGVPDADRFRLDTLGLIVYGGASMDAGLLERAMTRFGCRFHQQYGMTETGVQTILRPEDHDVDDMERLTSAGYPALTFAVEVVDEGGSPVGPGTVGEIRCTGPSLMTGYWNLPDATAATLRGGWMHTGDLGYLDTRGALHVVDRIKDMIVTGGENVYPREVEAVLADMPEAPEAAVVGIPDLHWGERVVGVVTSSTPPVEALDAFLRARLASYKVPREWVVLPELPRNSTGKVLKVDLRRLVAERLEGDGGRTP